MESWIGISSVSIRYHIHIFGPFCLNSSDDFQKSVCCQKKNSRNAPLDLWHVPPSMPLVFSLGSFANLCFINIAQTFYQLKVQIVCRAVVSLILEKVRFQLVKCQELAGKLILILTLGSNNALIYIRAMQAGSRQKAQQAAKNTAGSRGKCMLCCLNMF